MIETGTWSTVARLLAAAALSTSMVLVAELRLGGTWGEAPTGMSTENRPEFPS